MLSQHGLFIQQVILSNAFKGYFDQRLECAAPKHWSKYTTVGVFCAFYVKCVHCAPQPVWCPMSKGQKTDLGYSGKVRLSEQFRRSVFGAQT